MPEETTVATRLVRARDLKPGDVIVRPGPASVTEDDLSPIPMSGPFPDLHDVRLVPCDVLPIWHLPGRCPTSFLCPTPKEDQ